MVQLEDIQLFNSSKIARSPELHFAIANWNMGSIFPFLCFLFLPLGIVGCVGQLIDGVLVGKSALRLLGVEHLVGELVGQLVDSVGVRILL